MFSSFIEYFKEGVMHLLGGPDHLIFLLVLLLPSVAVQGDKRKALFGVIAAVSGFTLAHALTLTAAATSILRPPTALVELLIAVSIVITALDNLRPFIPVSRTAVATFFGLIHGFGFASALGPLPLTGPEFVMALLGFNLGIEIAQVFVVLLAVPILVTVGRGGFVLNLGSYGAIAIGVFWVLQRVGV